MKFVRVMMRWLSSCAVPGGGSPGKPDARLTRERFTVQRNPDNGPHISALPGPLWAWRSGLPAKEAISRVPALRRGTLLQQCSGDEVRGF